MLQTAKYVYGKTQLSEAEYEKAREIILNLQKKMRNLSKKDTVLFWLRHMTIKAI